jgi:hypothetical protein
MSDLQLSLDNTTLLEAVVWRDDHRPTWDAVVVWAHDDADRRGHCSMQTYFEALRSPAVATRLGLQKLDEEPYKINHNLRSGLTRLMLADYPYLPFRPRRSKCDPSRASGPGPRP